MHPNFPLQTTRLLLRPFADGDIKSFVRYRSDPEVARYQTWETPYPLEKAAQFVSVMKSAQAGAPGEWYQVAIELKATGALIGDVAFIVIDDGEEHDSRATARLLGGVDLQNSPVNPVDHENPDEPEYQGASEYQGAPEYQGEIAFTLARAFQGFGYASEAVGRLLDFLFDDLNLHRVRANCDPANAASSRLMRRVGMRYEGRFVDSLWLKGEWVSEDWYAVLRSERPRRMK